MMDFQIVNNKGVYEIHGDFTTTNTNEVAFYFSNLLDKYYEIVICLKKVRKFDDSALKVMQFLTNKATRRSKTLFVLGKNNKRITSLFNKTSLKGIFRNDYDC